MKKMTIPVMLTLAIYSLFSTLAVQAEVPPGDKSRQLEAVKAGIKKLEKTLKDIRKERSSLERTLQANEKSIGNLHREIRTLEQGLREGRAELKTLSNQRETLARDKETGLQTLATTLRSAYIAGQDSPLKLLLNQKDPDAVTRLLTYQRYFSDAQQNVINELGETIDRLASTETLLATTNRTLEENHDKLASQRNRLTTSNQRRQQLLGKLKKEEKHQGQRLTTLEKQQQELEQLIAAILEMESSASFDRPFTDARGKLPWPVKGRIKHRFGQNRADSTIPWKGLFIEAAAGTPVKAPWHGQVIFADWLKGFGLLMILNHGNEYMTLYAHNQALMRNVGDWVSAGNVIAETGATGGNNDNGLYFELRHNGKPVNPSQWLAR